LCSRRRPRQQRLEGVQAARFDPRWALLHVHEGGPELCRDLLAHGLPAKEGDTIYRKKYAAALTKIANEGADAFYTGAIADDIIKATSARNGILTHDDLANYTALQQEAISTTFRGKTVHTMDAPSSGLVMLGLLNIYEPYFGQAECWSTDDMFHRLESMRFAFGARTKVSDPAFNPNRTLIESYKTKEWADEQRARSPTGPTSLHTTA
jgi:gamma-glutamyltranspeptidase/glutathione hydrolase/leukotriene-C4 hydrolase